MGEINKQREDFEGSYTVQTVLFPQEVSLLKYLIEYLKIVVVFKYPDYYHFRKIYDNFKNHQEYAYLRDFINKFETKISNEDSEKLRNLLARKGFPFSKEDLQQLLVIGQKVEFYDSFKNSMDKQVLDAGVLNGIIRQFCLDNFDILEKLQNLKENGSIRISTNVWMSNEGVFNLFARFTIDLYFLQEYLLANSKIIPEASSPIDLIPLVFRTFNEIDLERFEKNLKNKDVVAIEDIDRMSGVEFEEFLKKLYEKMGYVVEMTPCTGDQGADLVIKKQGETKVVQAKRSADKVSNKAIQEVTASLNYYKATQGIVITNNEFTPSAYALANSNNIELIDRNKLVNFISQNM